ncbi:MAG: molybdate ABC transporter substrate-binding protein [Lagierella massiliensis]|nr:molybdate ABC transporter substrate-binding protein [Lagierella massiliensis]
MKIKKILTLGLFLTVMVVGVSCTKGDNSNVDSTDAKDNGEILVGAAASLTDALNEVKPIFEDKENCVVNFTYAASGTLQKQIEEDGGIDVFISASEDKMNNLVEKNLIEDDTLFPVLKNTLVLITNKESDDGITLDNLTTKANKIAIGQPDVVPAGQYAKQSLENLNMWNEIQEKYVFAKDVRAVLAYVSTGESEAGFVYKSDASIDENVQIVEELKDDLHDPIVYPGAVVKSSENKELSKKFLDFLKEDEAKEILTKYGFSLND